MEFVYFIFRRFNWLPLAFLITFLVAPAFLDNALPTVVWYVGYYIFFAAVTVLYFWKMYVNFKRWIK